MRILIVEDDTALAAGLVSTLKLCGFAVDLETSGTHAAQVALSEPFGLIVLDLCLPGLSGLEVLRQIRASGSTVPVMILTVLDGVADRVKGLDLGADDYLAKPFDVAEFEARVRALLRRGHGSSLPRLTSGALMLDRSRGEVFLNGEPVPLRRRELAVLTALMTQAGRVVPKDRLSREIFGFEEPVTPNALELYVGRLRRKLAGGPEIRTIRGLGYLLESS